MYFESNIERQFSENTQLTHTMDGFIEIQIEMRVMTDEEKCYGLVHDNSNVSNSHLRINIMESATLYTNPTVVLFFLLHFHELFCNNCSECFCFFIINLKYLLMNLK